MNNQDPLFILQRCPFNWEGKTFYELTIEEVPNKLPLLLGLFSACELTELESFRDKDEKFLELCKILNSNSPRIVNKVLNNFIEFSEEDMQSIKFSHGELLFKLAKQNNVLTHLINLKQDEEKPKVTSVAYTLDPIDSIVDIVSLNIWPGLTLLNYKSQLTYTQLEYLSEKASNYNKKKMLSFYQPLIFALGNAFGGKDSGPKESFQDLLFVKKYEASKYEKNRKIWFHEKWDDKDFVVGRARIAGMDLTMFYPESELKDLDYKNAIDKF